MEPPVYSAPPRKGMSTGLIVGLVLGGIFLCCILPVGLLVGAGFWGFGKIKGMAQCAITMQDVQKGIMKYAADHDGKLPNAATWQDDVREYYRKSMSSKKELGPFTESSPDGDWGCSVSEGVSTGLAFNDELSGKTLSSIKDPYSTVLVYETAQPVHNQHGKYSPQSFETSPMFMSKHRGWFMMPVEGPVTTNAPGRTNMKFTTGP